MGKVRTLQEINNEYFQTAAMLGDLVWKVSKFTGETLGNGQIEDLKRKMRTIDAEMDELQKQQERDREEKAKLAKKTNGAAPAQDLTVHETAPPASELNS